MMALRCSSVVTSCLPYMNLKATMTAARMMMTAGASYMMKSANV